MRENMSLSVDEQAPSSLDWAIAMQRIEGNPLTADEIEMLKMFEREGWSDERCLAYIKALPLLVRQAVPE